MEPVPQQEKPFWPSRTGEAAVSRKMSSRASLRAWRSWTETLPEPRTARYLQFLAARESPSPQRPAAWWRSTMTAASFEPFSAAGPTQAMLALGAVFATLLKTESVVAHRKSGISSKETWPSEMWMPTRALARPVMTTPSQPARLSSVASLPPTEESPTAPVSGERDIMQQRPEVGATVALSGPAKTSTGMAGSSQARVQCGRR